MNDSADKAQDREDMVRLQIAGRGIEDEHVLSAMRSVPRHAFVPDNLGEFAYQDGPLPIGEGQTISQPYIVASMMEAARIERAAKVLEIGAGSGYAAAVAGKLAAQVIAVERHHTLVNSARERMRALGYHNVDIREGDGCDGLAEEAPFDAILVAAGAPVVPEKLKEQLKIGGRLVIPVGDERLQELQVILREGENRYSEKSIGKVRFVPLVGQGAWPDPDAADEEQLDSTLPAMIRKQSVPLPDPHDPDFGAAFDRYADRRIVLLGESSHGTREFYRARAAVTRHLVEKHGFSIVAVEADWPDAGAIDRFIRDRPSLDGQAEPFARFPRWMWRNPEIAELARWLRDRNRGLDEDSKTGFYGLDLYNMTASIDEVLAYLDHVDPGAAEVARERYGCLTPWQHDPASYGRSALSMGFAQCESDVVSQLTQLLEQRLEYEASDGAYFLDAVQNARLIASAEKYYRIMYYGGSESWNLRDSHMCDTLTHLLDHGGPDAKAVVWAHNSHIGDARATEMGRSGEHNLGQLCRERFGDDVVSIGFGTHTGTVSAASRWGGEREVKPVAPSRGDSYEHQFHLSGCDRCLLDLGPSLSADLRSALEEPRIERFIGVIYRPETELLSHYSEAVLTDQFDGFVWFDTTTALEPLPENPVSMDDDAAGAVPDTFPFGV